MKKGIIIVLITLISIICGISKTSALEITQDVSLFGSKQFEYTNEDLTTYSIFKGKSFSNTSNTPQYYQWFIDGNTYDYNEIIDYIEIPLFIGQANTSSTSEDNYLEYCVEWEKRNINGIESYICSQINSEQYNSLEYKPQVILENLNIAFYVHLGDSYNMCQIKENTLICPTSKKKVNFIGMFYLFKTDELNYIPIYLGKVWNRYRLNNLQQETNNKLDSMNQAISGEQNYDKNASEEVNGKEEIDDYTEKEEQLFSSLDFEGIGESEIIINPNTSSFIWQMIEGLRGMSGKIILLMTSILGLGIIKMVLNR